jgi:hypothetical protein
MSIGSWEMWKRRCKRSVPALLRSEKGKAGTLGTPTLNGSQKRAVLESPRKPSMRQTVPKFP